MRKSLGFVVAAGIGLWLPIVSPGPSAQAQSATAEQHRCTVNGCGPDGFFGALIPNKVAGCKFKKACDAHDVCYSKCLVCHPFHTDATCHGYENKQKRRLACDTAFKDEMLAQNKSTRICRLAAEAYYVAVRKYGENLHRGVDPPSDRDKAEFEKLFREELERLERR